MKKLLTIVYITVLVACKINIGTKGSGKIITENRSIKDFTGVEASASIDVILKQGSSYEVKVEADDNIMDKVKTELDGNVLSIGYKNNSVISNGHVKVYVTTPTINKIKVNSSASIDATSTTLTTEDLRIEANSSGDVKANIKVNTLKAEASSSGDLQVEGSCTTANLTANSSGSLSAEKLFSRKAKADASSSGTVKVWAEEQLDAEASSSGSVRYKGNAKVTKKESSSGDVEAL